MPRMLQFQRRLAGGGVISEGRGATFTIELQGAKELQLKLLTLGSKSAIKTVVNRSIGAGLKVMERQVRANIRARTERRTGKLATGTEITKLVFRPRGQGGWHRKLQMKRRDYFGIAQGSEWYYPNIVEWGHPAPGREHAEGKRYFRDAVESKIGEATAVVSATAGRLIEEKARKLAGAA